MAEKPILRFPNEFNLPQKSANEIPPEAHSYFGVVPEMRPNNNIYSSIDYLFPITY